MIKFGHYSCIGEYPPPLNIPFLHEFPYNIDLQAGVFRLALKRTYGHYKNLVPDTDLEIRGARSFRPLDKGGGGVSIIFFSALRASVWSENKRCPGSPAPFPGSVSVISLSLKYQFYRRLFNTP